MATDPNTPDGRAAKHRSPNHPAYPLPKCLDRLADLYEKARTGEVPVPVACSYMGLSPTSSSGMRWQATLQEFGLAQSEGRGKEKALRVTELGRTLLKHPDRSSKEYRSALQSAALAPKMHRRVWDLRSEGHLPGDEHLLYTLSGAEWGFSEQAAAAFVSQFRETIAFAGLTAEDAEEETVEEVPEAEDNSPEVTPQRSVPPKGHKPETDWMSTNTETNKVLPIPLPSGGVVTLQLPYAFDEEDYKWLTTILAGLKRSMMKRDSRQTSDDPSEEAGQ